MTIKRFSIGLFVVVTLMLAVIVALVVWLGVAHSDLFQFESRRLRAFKLIDHLRQTEDDQSKFARAYVVTGDSKFLEFHRRIIAIRNGIQPRPRHYSRIYWDFVAADGYGLANAGISDAEAIYELLGKADLTPGELERLEEARREAEVLLQLETRAFEALGGGPDGRASAIRLLHGADYHLQKAKAMKPIDEFIGLLEARTGPELVAGVRRVMLLQAAILGVVAGLFLVVLVAGRKILVRVFVPIQGFQERSRMVGLDLKELARVATRIAKGDFSTAYATRSQTSGETARDEVGDLCRVQDGMVEHLRVAAAAITRIVGDLGRGAEELKKANAELLANRQKLEIILNSVDDGIEGLDGRGFITFENQAAGRMLGVEPGDLLGKFAHDALRHSHADGSPLPAEESPVHATLRDGVVRRVDGDVFWRGDGGSFPVEYVASPIRGAAGEVLGAVVVFRDLTERNRQEARLRESELRFRSLVTATSQIVWWTGPDGRVQGALESWQAYTGQSDVEIQGMGCAAAVHPEDRAATLAAWLEAGESRSVFEMEYRIRRHDGVYRHFAVRAVPVPGDDGSIREWVGACADITDRKRAEEALREGEARLNLALASSGVGTWVWNVAEDVVLWDSHLHPLFGMEPGTFSGRHADFLARVHPEDRERVERAYAASLERDVPLVSEHRVVWPDGSTRHLASRGKVYRDGSGRAAKVAGVCWDITRRKEDEGRLQRYAEELRRSNKELEHFAYVASHDLQEPLRTVASFSQLIERRYKGRLDAEADEFIGFIVDGANRMQRLINDLLTYSRVGTRGRTFERVDLEAVLRTVLRDMEAVIQDTGAQIIHDPLPAVSGDEVQLRQLIQNLIGNAVKFRKPGERPEVHVSAAKSGPAWEIRVRDNGIGIDPQYFQRVFVIFQRLHARNAYEGTGIGLAVCKKIVERHGGRIWVDSEPGVGATLCFTLPDPTTKNELL